MSIRANELSRVTTLGGNDDVILVDPSTNSGSIINAQALADSGVPHGYNDLKQKVAALSGGTPAAAKTVSEMTDKTRLYVYTGSETGYTAGNWYYWSGAAWTSGGKYGDVVVDDTLTVHGAAADAKAAGDEISVNRSIYLGLYPVSTASGDIAVIHDGADDLPVRDLSVGIEPVQSLNGYDHPWAGGAGKNLLLARTTNYSQTLNGITCAWDVNNETFTFSGTNTNTSAYIVWFSNSGNGSSFFPATVENGKKYYLSSNLPTGAYCSIVYLSTSGKTETAATLTGNGTFRSVECVFSDFDHFLRLQVGVYGTATSINATNVHVMFSETQAATYEPYSNICPITGWNAVKVARTGKNILEVYPRTGTSARVTYTNNPDGSVTLNGTASVASGVVLPRVMGNRNLRPGTYYARLFGNNLTGLTMQVYSNGSSTSMFNKQSGSFVIPDDSVSNYIRIRWDSGTVLDNITVYPMLVEGTEEPTAYEYPQADTHSLTLPSTVYGGTLDVTKGILTVDRGFVTWNGSEDWVLSGGKKVRCNIYALQNLIKRPASASEVLEGLQASYLTAQTDNATYQGTVGISCQTNGVVGITLTGEATTVDTVKAYLTEHPLQVVYPLATPQTYTLTPVQVKALLGENRIYADAGDVTVEYRVDFNEAGLMYIPKAPTADGTYRLTVDVTGGTPTYRWEAAE